MDDELENRRRPHRRECLRAKPSGTAVASVTGLTPKMHFLAMLTTLSGVRGDLVTPVGPVRPLRVVLAPIGQSSRR